MNWVACPTGRGYRREIGGSRAFSPSTFPENTVARIIERHGQWTIVRFPHKGEEWFVDATEVVPVDMHRDWWHERDPERICNTCLRLLPNEEFDKDNKRADGTYQRRPACKTCKAATNKNRKRKLTAEEEARKPEHGDEWQCPVCQHVFIAGVTARVTADHDHDTGEFRDFICDRCNSGMGRFRNGVDAMLHAAEYLDKHGAAR